MILRTLESLVPYVKICTQMSITTWRVHMKLRKQNALMKTASRFARTKSDWGNTWETYILIESPKYVLDVAKLTGTEDFKTFVFVFTKSIPFQWWHLPQENKMLTTFGSKDWEDLQCLQQGTFFGVESEAAQNCKAWSWSSGSTLPSLWKTCQIPWHACKGGFWDFWNVQYPWLLL